MLCWVQRSKCCWGISCPCVLFHHLPPSCSSSFISPCFCLGRQLFGHQRPVRCHLQDGGQHDQRQNPRGDQEDFQHQKWFHRGGGSPGTYSNPSAVCQKTKDFHKQREITWMLRMGLKWWSQSCLPHLCGLLICPSLPQVRKENQWCEEK